MAGRAAPKSQPCARRQPSRDRNSLWAVFDPFRHHVHIQRPGQAQHRFGDADVVAIVGQVLHERAVIFTVSIGKRFR